MSVNGSESRLKEIAILFLRLGITAFGGPAAHIAMMEDEVVKRRGWLSHGEFLDLLGATNLIPGPNSTEMAIHIGHRRAGWAGLTVAGVCFILPAALIVMGIAWLYVRYGKLPESDALLYGIKPVIIAVVLQALWRLGKSAVKSVTLGVIGIAAAILNFAGVNELIVLFGAGAMASIVLVKKPMGASFLFPMPIWQGIIVSGGTGVVKTVFSVPLLFLFFLKVGSVLFGSGYVLLAFLRADLVERWGWLSEGQLLDAIAVGQFTPGPVFTTATFIGYILAGGKGALAATVGIFLPAFIFVAISGPLVPRIRHSKIAGSVLDGINVASLALMLVVTLRLGKAAIVDAVAAGLMVVSFGLLMRFKINSAWLVGAGALIGLVKWGFRW